MLYLCGAYCHSIVDNILLVLMVSRFIVCFAHILYCGAYFERYKNWSTTLFGCVIIKMSILAWATLVMHQIRIWYAVCIFSRLNLRDCFEINTKIIFYTFYTMGWVWRQFLLILIFVFVQYLGSNWLSFRLVLLEE